MDTKIDFLYLSEPDMIKAGVKDMAKCVDCMEDLLLTLNKGDYMMGGENHNSHGCMIMFPDDPKFPECQKTVLTADLWRCLHTLAEAISLPA